MSRQAEPSRDELLGQVRRAQRRRKDRAAPRSDQEILEQVRTTQTVRRARLDELGGKGKATACPDGQEVVYIFLLGDRSIFKIGRTCHLSQRLSAHRREFGTDIRVLALIACPDRAASVTLERDLHNRCRRWRWRGRAELFSVTQVSSRALERLVLKSSSSEWVRYANRRVRR